MRLVKYLAHCGVASRRGAEQLIAARRVTIDGQTVTDPARDVDVTAEVRLNGEVKRPEQHEYYVLNKPKGVVSTADDPQGRPKVVDLVSGRGRVYPVGRLDIETTGLILLTNDGELANRLTHPSYEVKKRYQAKVKGRVTDQALQALGEGVSLEDGATAPAEVELVRRDRSGSKIELTIHEGRNRQVRRMMEAVGFPVIELKRLSLGPIELGGLKEGRCRELSATELELLWHNLGNEQQQQQ